MKLPIVSIVGRPNVGKSTFFNKLIGSRLSIVEDTPGVTRDRIYAEAEWTGHRFALIDTGGIEVSSEDVILSQMREQAQLAMDMSDVILFIVDGKEGLSTADEEVAGLLRRVKKPIILVINKIDNPNGSNDNVYDFYSLGLDEPMLISATNMMGLGDVLDKVVEEIGKISQDVEDDEDITKVAIIGKPNVGKSSLVNALLGENRVIVSDIAGTTRDAIDSEFIYKDEKYILIDTAGIRRRAKVNEDIERYSVVRAIAAIERSDVCVLMIDARDKISEQDKKIAGIAHEAGKGIIIAINKWDLIEKDNHTMESYRRDIQRELPFLAYAPEIFISVTANQRLSEVFDAVEAVAQNRAMRVRTGQLNALITDAMMMHAPPADKGKRLKIYYASQIGVKPPLFSFQVNNRELMHFSYARYLENKIRESFGFTGTSIKFVYRGKTEKL